MISLKKRPKPEIIVSEALQKSIEIIAKFDYKITDEKLIEYKTCYFCKNQFPTVQGKVCTCQNCAQTFCVKHRNVLNHHCQKLDPNLEKYLAAKSLFKEKIEQDKKNWNDNNPLTTLTLKPTMFIKEEPKNAGNEIKIILKPINIKNDNKIKERKTSPRKSLTKIHRR